MKKKIFLVLCLICLLCMCSNVFALTKLHETSEKQVINSGTNLTKYKRLTDKGWLAINIIDVDLKDENTTVSVLTSSNGLKTLQNVKTMLTNSKNCIAAINADFFNGNTNKGNIIGMTIRDGQMLSSTYYENEVKDTLATFVLNDDDEVVFDYFTNKITLSNLSRNESICISEINKWSSNYEYSVLYTPEWGEYSLGSTSELVLTELVVEDGKVREVRYNADAVKIPEDGYVISALGNVANVIQSSFKVGNKVKLDIDLELDMEKVKVAVSGGTILVKDGSIPTFTHNITGSNPRTAVGVSKDGETLYLITVDGRQASSFGLTQTEFAEILVEKGIYTAMNLDGGGSTTMVVRELGDEVPTVENSPSDNALRNVPNAIAVFNTDRTSSLNNLKIEVDDVNVFVGCNKELKVKGYDKYYNPVEIDEDKIKWSYDGVPVSIKDNILTGGDDAGSTTITASIGKAKGSITIDVLSQPNELTISPKKVTLGKGESVTFKVSGQNKNGYFANLNNDEATWKVESGKGSIKDGVFTADASGDYIISVSAGNAKSYALITVGEGASVDSFNTILPADEKGADESNTSGELENSNSFRIVVAPEITDNLLLSHLKGKKLENIINNNAEIVTFPSQSGSEMLASVSKDKVIVNGYNVKNYKSATIISLDISNGGLRATNSNEWISMKSDITHGNKNILIIMNGNINDFKDEDEKQFFIDALCDLKRTTGKNIWVIQKGDNTDYSMMRGVKYLSIASDKSAEPSIESIRNDNYILITVNDSKMTYEIKNMYEK